MDLVLLLRGRCLWRRKLWRYQMPNRLKQLLDMQIICHSKNTDADRGIAKTSRYKIPNHVFPAATRATTLNAPSAKAIAAKPWAKRFIMIISCSIHPQTEPIISYDLRLTS
jgi:hypothetical protein